MKVLNRELTPSKDIVARFQREAREAAQTEHAGIVKVTDFGALADGAFYLLMEFLEGESLQGRIERGPLPVHDVLEIGCDALAALQVAHDRGLVHRDIKPENIFLPKQRRGSSVKILDF